MAGDQGAAAAARRGIVALAAIALAAEMVRAPTVHLDFAPLYGAALLAGAGRLDEAYAVDPTVRKRAAVALTDAVHARGYPMRHCLRYLHAPALAALVWPLTAFDFPWAAYLFRALSLAALAIAAFLLAREYDRADGPPVSRSRNVDAASAGLPGAALACLVLLGFDPVRMTLDLGQTNLFVLVLLLVGIAGRRPLYAGIALAVAGLFKTHALLVPLVWLFCGREARWRAFVAFVAWAGAHAIAYLAWPDATFAYLDMLRDLSAQQFLWPEQQSVAALLARIATGFSAEDVSNWVERVVPSGSARHSAIAIGVGVSAALVAWVRAARLDARAAAALAIPAALFASPVLHSHYGVVLVIPVVWLAREVRSGPAFWLGISGLALQALPLHSDEAKAFVPVLADLGAHWWFVTYRLAGVALVLAGVLWATIRQRGAHADGGT